MEEDVFQRALKFLYESRLELAGIKAELVAIKKEDKK